MATATAMPGDARTQLKILPSAADDLKRELGRISKEVDNILMASEIARHRVNEVCKADALEVMQWHVTYLMWQVAEHLDEINNRIDRIKKQVLGEVEQ